MKRRTLLAFVVLNVVISIAVTLTVATLVTQSKPEPTPIIPPTVIVMITNTPGPTQTPDILVVTATPDPDRPVGPAPSGGDAGDGGEGSDEPVSTEGPTETPTLSEGELTATAATFNELQTHTVASGEFWGLIAESYGVSLADLLCQNGMTETDIIYPGDVLVIPGPEGCTYRPPDEGDESPGDETADITRTPLPTITLQPTAANAQVRITAVIAPGDVTAEEVTLTNEGGLLDLKDWTLYDRQGNTFTFPDYRLFPGGSVSVRTRRGENTPIVLYWDLSSAVWGEPGDAVTLADVNGTVQSIYRLDTEVETRTPEATETEAD